MKTCPCLESIKTLITTGKWEGGSCECGKNITATHLIVAGAIGFLLSILLGALFFRSRRD